MTVQELIDKLNSIEDKERIVLTENGGHMGSMHCVRGVAITINDDFRQAVHIFTHDERYRREDFTNMDDYIKMI